ncbi:MAG: hypothetical protein V2I38_17465 [Alcanivoracaceae bacterium]|jgi:hypothetical protein|nr:hypothetical protein [Alcanivoracaceae bacterium]
MFASDPSTRTLKLFPALLVLVIVGAQLLAWHFGVVDGAGKWALASVEMVVMLALLWNGWRIRLHLVEQGASAIQQRVATLVFWSLAICILGDLVNRNLPPRYFSYDSVIEHSYLADSVWFFFPGYALFIAAAWLASRDRVAAIWRIPALLVVALAGLFSFFDLVQPGTATYIQIMTGAYTVLISMMVPAGLWILLAFGKRSWPVALGAVLATVADALIGHFWLFGSGWYPAIAFINFIVYFLSQALIQQLPLIMLPATASHHTQQGRA